MRTLSKQPTAILFIQVHVSDMGDHGSHVPDDILRGRQQDHESDYGAQLLLPVRWERLLLCRYFLCHKVSFFDHTYYKEVMFICMYVCRVRSSEILE